MNNSIDMSKYVSEWTTSLVGRQNGKDCKRRIIEAGIVFDELEKEVTPIIIQIPETIISMNRSFFLAVWEDRIMALGKDGFREKYSFDTSQHIQDKVSKHIESTLRFGASMKFEDMEQAEQVKWLDNNKGNIVGLIGMTEFSKVRGGVVHYGDRLEYQFLFSAMNKEEMRVEIEKEGAKMSDATMKDMTVDEAIRYYLDNQELFISKYKYKEEGVLAFEGVIIGLTSGNIKPCDLEDPCKMDADDMDDIGGPKYRANGYGELMINGRMAGRGNKEMISELEEQGKSGSGCCGKCECDNGPNAKSDGDEDEPNIKLEQLNTLFDTLSDALKDASLKGSDDSRGECLERAKRLDRELSGIMGGLVEGLSSVDINESDGTVNTHYVKFPIYGTSGDGHRRIDANLMETLIMSSDNMATIEVDEVGFMDGSGADYWLGRGEYELSEAEFNRTAVKVRELLAFEDE